MDVRSFDRFDLRDVAEFFCCSALEILSSLRSASYFLTLDSLTVVAQIESDRFEVTTEAVLNGAQQRWVRSYELPTSDPLLVLLAEEGGFDLDLTFRSTDQPSVDAVYAFGDEQDTGQITLVAELPLEQMSKLCEDHRWLRGLLSHEMQHLVQRVIYGHAFVLASSETLRDHMIDKEEIDARIEEIIASQDDDSCTVDADLFLRHLTFYVEDYLKRNDLIPGSEQFESFREEMLDVHMINFRKKFNLWGLQDCLPRL